MKKFNTHTVFSVQEATTKLEAYCAYRERCHKEVREKLKKMRMIPEAIDRIIHHLITENYLNETRFAKSFARGKFKIKKWGKQRIVRELKFREITSYNIQLALKEISNEEYFTTFDALVEKRLHQLTSEKNLQKKKRKLADYLMYRGWEPELVWEATKEVAVDLNN